MEVYKLGLNTKSSTAGKVLITLEVIDGQTDLSSFTKDIEKYKHALLNDFYFPYKINCGKVLKITDLEENSTFDNACINTGIHGKINLKTGNFFKISDHDYKRNEERNNYSFTVYKYKAGVLNEAKYVGKRTTGTRYYYMSNGKIREKVYYKNGVIIRSFDYYNNPYNSMKASFLYTETGVLQTEYYYDQHENITRQVVRRPDGTVFNSVNYDPDDDISNSYDQLRPSLVSRTDEDSEEEDSEEEDSDDGALEGASDTEAI